jgi:hypothetical protein
MMSARVRRGLLGLVAAAIAGLAQMQPAAAATPMTPAGWQLTPAGRQTTVTIGPGLAGPGE